MLLCTSSASTPDRFVHQRNRVVSRLQLRTGHDCQLRAHAGVHKNINLGMVLPAWASSPTCLWFLCHPSRSWSLARGYRGELPEGDFCFPSTCQHPLWGSVLCPKAGRGAGICCSLLTEQGKLLEPDLPPKDSLCFNLRGTVAKWGTPLSVTSI